MLIPNTTLQSSYWRTQQCCALASFSGHCLYWIGWERPVHPAIREWSVFSTVPLTIWKWLWKFHGLPIDFCFLCITEQLFSQAFDSVLEIFERKGFKSKALWNAKHYFYCQLKIGPLTSDRYISLIFLWFFSDFCPIDLCPFSFGSYSFIWPWDVLFKCSPTPFIINYILKRFWIHICSLQNLSPAVTLTGLLELGENLCKWHFSDCQS